MCPQHFQKCRNINKETETQNPFHVIILATFNEPGTVLHSSHLLCHSILTRDLSIIYSALTRTLLLLLLLADK
jgi:hypothetical protein